jgi:hypothetical protein
VNTTQVIRRGEGTKVIAEQANYQAILLAACPPGARRDIYLLLTQPGADRISHPHPPGSVEHIIVTQGRAGRPDGSAGRAGEEITSAIPPIGSTFSRRWSRIPRRCWSPSRTSQARHWAFGVAKQASDKRDCQARAL